MRIPEYMSPTSLRMFYEDIDTYYKNYLSPNRPPRFPQNKAMAAGSAFDAYVKADLYKKIVNKGNPEFDFTTLFEAQVEVHNRDFGYQAGRHIFNFYQEIGSLNDLILELESSLTEPHFESTVRGMIGGHREGMKGTIQAVPFLGKPDVFFINKEGAHVILDWKVNGYVSKFAPSPKPGYVRLREYGCLARSHDKCNPINFHGVYINSNCYLEEEAPNWADQTTIYSWLCGENVGAPFISAIDQIVCNTKGMTLTYPELRVAQHKCRISEDYQFALLDKAKIAWEIITSGHIFRDMSLEESEGRCKLLDDQF